MMWPQFLQSCLQKIYHGGHENYIELGVQYFKSEVMLQALPVAAVVTNARDLSIFICKLSFEQALAHWVCMTSWSVVAGQLFMPGSSINGKSGLTIKV